jgi:hypothetical protein
VVSPVIPFSSISRALSVSSVRSALVLVLVLVLVFRMLSGPQSIRAYSMCLAPVTARARRGYAPIGLEDSAQG